jgi:protocatechuate 3,4-dioxygenase alpha subunit
LPVEKKADGFSGFGRSGTGTHAENRYFFTTIKPGCCNGQAPHINIILFMRGALLHLYTRMYFPEEDGANQNDALLNSIPADRRHTLIARRVGNEGQPTYHFDIYMQGENETVFFDL